MSADADDERRQRRQVRGNLHVHLVQTGESWVKPEKNTLAGILPNMAVACFGVVGWRLVEDAGLPVTIAPLTGPRPVA